jgi:uncharacterized protein YjiK
MEDEEWREIRDFPLYSVSSRGRVKSLKRNKEAQLKVVAVLNKYKHPTSFHVLLYKNNAICANNDRFLVAEAFLPNPHGYKFVTHINGDKGDNCVSNLQWSPRKTVLFHMSHEPRTLVW